MTAMMATENLNLMYLCTASIMPMSHEVMNTEFRYVAIDKNDCIFSKMAANTRRKSKTNAYLFSC